MILDHKEAFPLLLRVDRRRVRAGRAVGLRDSAVLALVAGGLSTVQIASLRASDVTIEEGRVAVWFRLPPDIAWYMSLPTQLGDRLLAWIREANIQDLPVPLFHGCRGPLTAMGVWKIFERYRNPKPARGRRKAA
jgi:integrase